MRIQVVSPASKLPDWVSVGVGEYQKRLPPPWALSWDDIRLPKRATKGTVSKLVEQEGELILSRVSPHSQLIALDVQGKTLSTHAMAKKLGRLSDQGQSLTLAIGGPDGLSKAVLSAADEVWSLSALTLPHPLVRVVVAEQIYRCWSLLHNHPYHRA